MTGDHDEEKRSAKAFRASISRDRAAWLEELTTTGDWKQIRKLRKGFCPKQGRLRDLDGNLVDSDQRAETLANYLEKVQ